MNSITKSEYDQILDKAASIQKKWREVPAPRRGELLRVFGNKLRESQIDQSKENNIIIIPFNSN